jgi:hypothetical protein
LWYIPNSVRTVLLSWVADWWWQLWWPTSAISEYHESYTVTAKWWVNFCKKSSCHTKGIRMWGCPSFSPLTGHPPMTQQAWPQLT